MNPRLQATMDFATVAGALATIPLTVLQEQGARSTLLDAIDWVVWSVFAFELLTILWCTPWPRLLKPYSLATSAAVVVLSFPPLPTLLALVRLARMVRLLRLLRLTGVATLAIDALKQVLWRRGLLYTMLVTTLLILVGGGCLSIIEPQTVKGGFGDGIWWAVVTASTVGYGDIAPTTLLGRIIAVFLMLVGIGLMSTLAASITSYFVQQNENTELKDVRARLERIERMLQQLARE